MFGRTNIFVDTYLFDSLHQLVGYSRVLDLGGILLAEYLAYVIGIAVVYWVYRHAWKWLLSVEITASVVLSRGIITEIIRLLFHRARPFIDHFTPLVSVSPGEYYGSFPSGHMTFFFALATTVWLYNKRFGRYLLIGAFLMGIARIFVGIHWPSDILGGAVIGIASAFIVHALVHRIADRYFSPKIS